MKELWKNVKGYGGTYFVSNQGSFKNCKYKTHPKLLSVYVTVKGYSVISFSCGGVSTKKRLHVVMLETFVGPCPAGMEGCHIDDDKSNNNIKNLKWNTHANNMKDQIRNGKSCQGSKHYRTSLTDSCVRHIRLQVSNGVEYKVLALEFSKDVSTISDIVRRKSWKHI